MKLSYYIIVFYTCFYTLSINPHASSSYNIGHSRFVKVPLPIFRESLVSTMDLVQNVISAMSQIHGGFDGEGQNINVPLPYCAHLLGETASTLSWILSAIDQEHFQGYSQFHTTGNAIAHARTLLNSSLGSQETCMEVVDGTKHFMVARSLRQVTTNVHEILDMLQVPQFGPDFSKPPRAPLLDLTGLRINDFAQRPNAVVSLDGAGHFRRIMDAVAAAPSHSPNHFVILVKRGIYHEYVDIDNTKSNLVLIGEGMDATIISGRRSVRGGGKTMETATFAVRAIGFIAKYIGFENTAGQQNGQAVAVLSSGDRSAFYKCRIAGNQDTLLVLDGRQFYRGCKISGTVDFIFGYGSAVFQRCDIYIEKNHVGGTSVIAAQGCNSPHDSSGFSFHLCSIRGDPNVVRKDPTLNGAYLGRAWGAYARTVFMQTYISNVLRPEGWLQWHGDKNTMYFGEYRNTGPGRNIRGRVRWPGVHAMNPYEADRFTVAKLIDGTSWLLNLGIPVRLGLGPYH